MATKSRKRVGYFIVTSFCRRGAHPTSDIKQGSKDVEHVIEIKNGSTLPYDVTVDSVDPAAHPHTPSGRVVIEFSRAGGSRRTDWRADIPQLADGDTWKDFASIYCVKTTTIGNIRINSPEPQVKYRLDSNDAWQSDPTSLGIMSIDLTIT